jgi:hypothetical protein
MVLGGQGRSGLQVHRRRAQQLDSLDRRGLLLGIDGISFLLIMLTTLLGADLDPLVVDRDRESA